MMPETSRQCVGAGSSPFSRCRVFPGTEASAHHRPLTWRKPLQRETLEVGLESGWRGRFGRQAAPTAVDQAVREAKTTADSIAICRPARCGIQDRLVDLCASCQTGSQAFWREAPSGPSGAYPARPWFQPAETEASSARTGPRSHRTVAKARLASHQKKHSGEAQALFLSMKLDFGCNR